MTTNNSNKKITKIEDGIIDAKILEEIINSVKELDYGNVTLVIQDSKIVQIHKTEKRKVKK